MRGTVPEPNETRSVMLGFTGPMPLGDMHRRDEPPQRLGSLTIFVRDNLVLSHPRGLARRSVWQRGSHRAANRFFWLWHSELPVGGSDVEHGHHTNGCVAADCSLTAQHSLDAPAAATAYLGNDHSAEQSCNAAAKRCAQRGHEQPIRHQTREAGDTAEDRAEKNDGHSVSDLYLRPLTCVYAGNRNDGERVRLQRG